jgi:hypothetical protein
MIAGGSTTLLVENEQGRSAEEQKSRATESAFEMFYHQRVLQEAEAKLVALNKSTDKHGWDRVAQGSRAALEREEAYHRLHEQLGYWPERPVLTETATRSELADWEEHEEPHVPEKSEPQPWPTTRDQQSPWTGGWST